MNRLFTLLWATLVFLWAVLLLPILSFATGPVHTHVFHDDVQEKVGFEDSLYLFLDWKGTYDIEQIINSPELAFVRSPQTREDKGHLVVWTKLILKNLGTQTRNEYFSHCSDADTIWIYTVKNGKVIDQKVTGFRFKPDQRSILSKYIYSPVTLDAGEEKTFYFKSLFTKPVQKAHYSHLYIQPTQPLLHRVLREYAWQAFYTGIMLVFCLFSLFMYLIFRDRNYIYFTFVTLFFGLYFMQFNGMIDAFITTWFRHQNIPIGQIIISGILIFIFLFSSQYLHLKTKMPFYYKLYLITTVICSMYAHIVELLGMDYKLSIYSQNINLAIWIVICITPAALLAINKDQKAKTLLLSIGALAIGAMVFLINFQNIHATHSWMKNGFQISTILFSGILFYALFDNINTILNDKRVIEERSRLKSNFFSNISHEFRTPLTLMLGPLEQLIERITDPKNKELAEMAHRNATRQLRMVNQLLDLSKIDDGKMDFKVREEDFIPFMKGIVNAYNSLALQKDIALTIDCPASPVPLYFNQYKMEIILYNLLSNAFKFTEPGGRIDVKLHTNKEIAILVVSDTGKGISNQYLPFIFDRFFQADLTKNEPGQGSGIGLALVKELVQLHGGSIEVTSKVGRGSTFTLHFPLGRNHLDFNTIALAPDNLSSATQVSRGVSVNAPTTSLYKSTHITAAPAGSPLVLIIEDNEDVRTYMRLRLENHFQITEALDGKEGIRKAIQILPDLIISDVMMPRKNGYEVCQALKSDLRTSHIPIILLTAKAAKEEKLDGLAKGADDFLTKPFDANELLIRVQNLIRMRKQLRERFAGSITIKPSEVVTNSLDQKFLEDVMRIVEANLPDENFTIDKLANEIGISRSNLNRKLRALINKSSNQFLLSVRLQRAADLLRQNAGSIAEIAFQTGFRSPAYFAKCFKEVYGETPGTFAKGS